MPAEGKIHFENTVVSRAELEIKISRGEFLLVAGDESVLASLPSGNWVGGTIPYFMTEDGGKADQNNLYVTTISGVSNNNPPRMTLYDENSISRIAKEAPEHGFSILILPAASKVHLAYAQNAPDYENMYFSPIVGWISGTHLDDLGSKTAKVGFGPASGILSDGHAVAMHIPLPEQQVANIKTVNLFTQGNGDAIRFNEKGFSVKDCTINGESWNLSNYIKEERIDTRLPLVADYSGIMVNASVQEVCDGEVKLYAPVFPDFEYHFAKPITDYVSEFNQSLPNEDAEIIAFSCNCILNFLYSELDGKKTGKLTGPITFGEIAYQTLNQTLVYLTLDEV